jgi:hypothetical protein
MKSTLGLFLALIALASCSKSSIRGSGQVVTETRTVPAFTAVRLEGSSSATLTKGTTILVEVSGYQNLVPIYETYVTNGTLVVKFRNDYYNIRNNNIKVSITVPSVERVSVNGSGDILIRNFSGTRLNADVNGSGAIEGQACLYDNANFEVNGSGDIRGRDIAAGTVEARISGSGKIEALSLVKLIARISGSGDIHYWGNPADVDVQISGSGKAIKK